MQGNIIDQSEIVKRADSNLAPCKVRVVGDHVWILHIIEVDLDESIFHVADNFDVVPGLVFPGRTSVGHFADLDTWGIVDNKDLIGVRVCLFTKVHVVKVGRILITKEDAHITVSARGLKRLHARCEHEVCHLDILDERNAVRTAMRWLVVALAQKMISVIAIFFFENGSLLFIGRLPVTGSIFKVIFENNGQGTAV